MSDVAAMDLTGLVSGLVAVSLFSFALLVAVGAAVRLLLVLRRPGQGRIARGLLGGAGLAGLVALGLFAGSEAAPTRWRHRLDRAAPAVALAALAAAAVATWRLARRAPAPAERAEPPPGSDPSR
jgi:hypothetical protein